MKTMQLLISSDLEPHSDDEQCNCACADTYAVSYDPALLPGDSLTSSSLYHQEIAAGQFLYFNPKLGSRITILNSGAKEVLDSFDPSRSINMDDDVDTIDKMVKVGILDRVNRETVPTCQSYPQILSAWMHLTDRCNLRCSYCYLPHVREDMSSETGRAAVDALFRSATINHFKQVKIKYAGGEALLRYPLILELHEYAQMLAEQQDLLLEEVVLSNGTLLTHEMARTLKSLGIRLMISLDGLNDYHDRHRPYAGGRGSFKDVSDAVELALENGLIPSISVTISSRTAEGLPEVMRWILERELPFSLNFYRENELSSSQEDMRLDEQKIINGMLSAFRVIENNLPRRSFLGGVVDRANLSAAHTYTCGVGQNYLVFDQHGQVAKCQMHIRKPITDLHAPDPLAIIRADQIGVQNLPVHEKEGCKTCEWKHWCAGGCPLETYRATGRYDVQSPNCNIYKALYPEALRLEGLRLLKYQDDPEIVTKY